MKHWYFGTRLGQAVWQKLMPHRATLWQDTAAIRADLFGAERLAHHALSLAAAQPKGAYRGVTQRPLIHRVTDNAAALLSAYRASAQSLQNGQTVSPAAEWLLDNFHLVEQQLRQISDDLPPDYYHQLPKLIQGPFAGYPRVLELTWAYVAHTDSLLSGATLAIFIKSYQTVNPLTMGELWAIAITLRIVLIENMRRLSAQILQAQDLRNVADRVVDQVLRAKHDPSQSPFDVLHEATNDLIGKPLHDVVAAQIAKRLRGFDPADMPLQAWLIDRLSSQSSTVDIVVQNAQLRQGASNVTMRNIVTSMRLASELDWADFVEDISLIDVKLRASSDFALMDFATRNSYRTAIEVLARGSDRSEQAVTDAALAFGAARLDPGFALIGPNRQDFQRSIGFVPPLGKRILNALGRLGLWGYMASIAWIGLIWTAVWGGQGYWAVALLGLAPACEAATAFVNLIVTRSQRPRLLPALDLSKGIPPQWRSLIAVPVILRDLDDLTAQIEQLEVHHLSSVGGAVHFALLSDGADASSKTTALDGVLRAAADAQIAALNAKYPTPDGNRFMVLHRLRQWNPAEGVWMAWERKRGKLTELNRLLRGASDTSFESQAAVPENVRFVVTLDADTRLLRNTVSHMIGKMAHPVNRAVFDPETQRVVAGYGILQPRVTPSLPLGQSGSRFQQIYTSLGGIEPYAAAVSNVYQDLFGQGSFAGKGIYDVDAFAAAMAGRVPENTMLSHDLFEGIYARAGLASDVDVVEDFPARFDVALRRQHRWSRGDWQLLPWLFGAMPALGRWKIFDNLRRAALAPLTMASLFAALLLPLDLALISVLAILILMALPQLIGLPFAVFPARAGITSRSHFAALWVDTKLAFAQGILNIIFLAQSSAQMLDAFGRTMFRLTISRKHLLQWESAAVSGGRKRPNLSDQYRQMLGGIILAVAVCLIAILVNPVIWPLAASLLTLWMLAPLLAYQISLPYVAKSDQPLQPEHNLALRKLARSTWRYFETFVTEADHFLPPDNFQETPLETIFHRTSPTNIGLYLLSITVAHDMGWIGRTTALNRLEQTLKTVQRMPKFRGHLFNWYDTTDLRVLHPDYVSTVDSGNLAGHLIAVAQACQDWHAHPVSETDKRAGLADTLHLARDVLGHEDQTLVLRINQLIAENAQKTRFGEMLSIAHSAVDLTQGDANPDRVFWVHAVAQCISAHAENDVADSRIVALGEVARQLALDMDFAFLLDPEKKLLSIGFSVTTNTLDTNCYDLLASEARLASLFAIAKGDVETRHWFRLGRRATPVGAGAALISWSGSMFEYLMPSLVMRAPKGSMLEQTNRLIVQRQIEYGAAHQIPWGVSESAYNARDMEMTYQYSNFGVPGLGLKRGLGANRVIAPYATGLATMVDPRAALNNLTALSTLGAKGRYGFYEAVDFTAARLPQGSNFAIIRTYMAHHQGMTITAIANAVQDGKLRARFHAEPMIQGVDLLLQERVPRDANAAPPRAEEVLASPIELIDQPILRHFDTPSIAAPTGHLLSNGQYGVMLTPTGAGYSRWGNLAITRWRTDPSQAALGSFIYAKDVQSDQLWSSALQPTGARPKDHSAIFCEHQASFTFVGEGLTMTTEIVVSAEDNAEARRVTLTNTGKQSREIDVTSYAELVLAPPAADLSHPAFSKLFVVTDYLPELGVVIATRRRRASSDPEIWAAHIAIVEGTETGEIQFETDRARFIGRGNTLAAPDLAHRPLTNTIGTVLDPIFSMRRRVLIASGEMARVTFWTAVAATPEALLDLVDRHRDPSAFDRAATLSWTQGQVQLRHLGVSQAAAADFQRLAGMILRQDTRLRAPDLQIIHGAGPQSGLWPMGISGDLPIVLFLISDAEDMDTLHEVLAAHEYWLMRQLDVDLVILNERASSYIQDMQTSIEVAVRSAQSHPYREGHPNASKGRIYTLRADLLAQEARALLGAVAAIILVASRGGIGAQIDALPPLPKEIAALPRVDSDDTTTDSLPKDLEFFNGTGGFGQDGREYVTILRNGQTTPAPWINVIANESFGFHVSAEGSGSVWAQNSRENQLTPWSNDPVTDPAGEAIYIHDLDSGAVWTATALPIRTKGTYVATHGFGYSLFDHTAHDIKARMTQFVPLQDPVKITRLELTNLGPTSRKLSLTAFAQWVLGAASSAQIITSQDIQTGAIFATNPYGAAFSGQIAFADFGDQTSSITADRRTFLGQSGCMAAPVGINSAPLSGRIGPALDPCAALQRHIVLLPGETREVVFLLGQADSTDQARNLINRHRQAQNTLPEVVTYWRDLLGQVQVRSPDRAMDIMLNGWLLYQTLACRIWARAGFYQASGAYGFRDQLQDGMAITALRPAMTRAHLLRAAGRQFEQGDVQHWWLPHSGQGVRTRISDDRVWLGFGVAQYIEVSGDVAILDVQVPFLDGPSLVAGQHDDFFQPTLSGQSASLFEHCARGLDLAIAETGVNGMPLIGTGDWNDGMNRVGQDGAGTSVWLGWLLIATIAKIAPHADQRDPQRAALWRAHARSVAAAIEANGWDGAWYRRGTYDDGSLLGSATSLECQIDSIAQSWAVLSGAADPVRAQTAMGSLMARLIQPEEGLALLFTPAFDQTDKDPGYIKGYPPGLRENGGQYSHAAMWAILAQCRLGNGDAAGAIFALVNPINHARTPAQADRYKVEPYVIAADVYSNPPHQGRGGWTWYTGSAGWMYRAGIEGLLGLTRQGDDLLLNPCFPKDWPELTATLNTQQTPLSITILNPNRSGYGIKSATLDGQTLPLANGYLRFSHGQGRRLTIHLI